MPKLTLGVIGTGHFASYTIAALRNGGFSADILLSPRNAERAAALADEHACRIAEDNLSVVSASDIVLLSVRPHQLSQALEGLAFRPDQIVLSALAGVTLHALLEHGLPVSTVRIMPSSFIEAGDAVFPIYPDNDVVSRLLEPAGKVVAFDNEPDFERSVLTACAYAWNYDLMHALSTWFVDRGWPAELARDMVVRHMRGASTYALAHPDIPLDTISAGIATDGTFTQRGLNHLQNRDAFSPWTEALSELDDALQSG